MEKDLFGKFVPFELSLTKTIEELRAVRVHNKDLEEKLKQAKKDKHEMELSLISTRTFHQEAELKSQAENISVKQAYEKRLMDISEERVANRLIIESLSNESKLLKAEINKLILTKLTAENKANELENRQQSNESLQEGVLNKVLSVKQLVEETECKYREAIQAQLKLQASVQQASSLCVTMQGEFQSGHQTISNLEETNRGLRNDLIALRSEIIFKSSNAKSTESSSESWSLSRDLERQSKVVEQVRSQMDELKIRVKDLANSLSEAHVLLKESAAREQFLNEQLGRFRDEASTLRPQVRELTERLAERQDHVNASHESSQYRKPEEAISISPEP